MAARARRRGARDGQLRRIFSDRAGPIGPDDAVDVKADAIVSPANGGIDALYTYQLGAQVQENLRARLARDLG